MPPLDLKKVAAEVSVQHGMRVDVDDPAMASVTIAQIVLEHSVSEVLEKLAAATRSIDDANARLQIRAGTALAQELKHCFAGFEREARQQTEAIRRGGEKSKGDLASGRVAEISTWIALGLVAGGLLLLVGIWIGARLLAVARVGG